MVPCCLSFAVGPLLSFLHAHQAGLCGARLRQGCEAGCWAACTWGRGPWQGSGAQAVSEPDSYILIDGRVCLPNCQRVYRGATHPQGGNCLSGHLAANRRQSCNLVFSQLNGPAADLPAVLSLLVPPCGGEMRIVGEGWSLGSA